MTCARSISFPAYPPPVGTLYVDPTTGDTYRYNDFGGTRVDKPTYFFTTQTSERLQLRFELPEDAVCIFIPDPELP